MWGKKKNMGNKTASHHCKKSSPNRREGVSLGCANARRGCWLGHHVGKADDYEGLNDCSGAGVMVVVVVVRVATSRGCSCCQGTETRREELLTQQCGQVTHN